jgi:hypothetical protein
MKEQINIIDNLSLNLFSNVENVVAGSNLGNFEHQMKYQNYSHNNADRVLSPALINETKNVIRRVTGDLSSAPNVRKAIESQLFREGWSDRIPIDPNVKISITSMKDDVGLCVQFGNMSRFYADLLKLQHLHVMKRISGAFYILPESAYAKELGSNLANYERFTNELSIFKTTITIPIMVFGVWS